MTLIERFSLNACQRPRALKFHVLRATVVMV